MTYGGVGVQLHVFLTSALAEDEWLASRPCHFTSRERAPGKPKAAVWTTWREVSVEFSRNQTRFLCRPARIVSYIYMFYYLQSWRRIVIAL
jgi:hypothetical protein